MEKLTVFSDQVSVGVILGNQARVIIQKIQCALGGGFADSSAEGAKVTGQEWGHTQRF